MFSPSFSLPALGPAAVTRSHTIPPRLGRASLRAVYVPRFLSETAVRCEGHIAGIPSGWPGVLVFIRRHSLGVWGTPIARRENAGR